MGILVDSDILIDVSRERDKPLLDRWHGLGASGEVVLCSPVTAAELWRGARPSEHAVLEALFTSLECVPIDYEIGRMAGGYMATYARPEFHPRWRGSWLILRVLDS